MSISAISGSSSYGSYSYDNNKSKRKSSQQDDPMTQAIDNLQSTDPALATKLGSLQTQVESMKKSGASDTDIQKTIKSTMDGLSDTEKSELQSAMPTPPAGGHHHAHGAGRPSGPPPSDPSDSSSGSDTSTASTSASSLLDSISSAQNDAIANFMSARSSYATVQ